MLRAYERRIIITTLLLGIPCALSECILHKILELRNVILIIGFSRLLTDTNCEEKFDAFYF